MATRNRKRKETASRSPSHNDKKQKKDEVISEVDKLQALLALEEKKYEVVGPKKRIHMDKEEVKLRKITTGKDGKQEIEEYPVDYEALGCENWNKYTPQRFPLVSELMAEATNEMQLHLCREYAKRLENESMEAWRERAAHIGVIRVVFPEHLVNIVFDYAYGNFFINMEIMNSRSYYEITYHRWLPSDTEEWLDDNIANLY